MAKVAVVGLGAMGSRIAQRLLDTGHDLVVWNRSAEKTAPFVAVESPAQAAQKADAVFVMVSDPQALREVTEGADGILAGAGPGTTVIQMSTVGPADVARLASSLPEGVELLDAPVLGSLSEAEGGTLRVFAGGSPELVEQLDAAALVARVGAARRPGRSWARPRSWSRTRRCSERSPSSARPWRSVRSWGFPRRRPSRCSRQRRWPLRPSDGGRRSRRANTRFASRSHSP